MLLLENRYDERRQAPLLPTSLLNPFVLTPLPRSQWGDSGGFCGALSIQVIGMSYGVYHSQDVIRKQAPEANPPGHGDPTEGYEILHSNVEGALQNLKFDFTSWDWENEPKPQGQAYLSWLKGQLVEGSGVVQFVMCKGDR